MTTDGQWKIEEEAGRFGYGFTLQREQTARYEVDPGFLRRRQACRDCKNETNFLADLLDHVLKSGHVMQPKDEYRDY